MTQARALPPTPGVDLPDLIASYYEHVSVEDLEDRSAQDLGASVLHHLDLARHRPQGTANVRVLTPLPDTDGWSAGGRTVVEVVTDDMPFLVDSVTMVLTAAGHEVQVVIHPQLVVRRDLTGELQEILTDRLSQPGSSHDVFRESWMHVEVVRVADGELDALAQRLDKTLLDVREAVEDWGRMHAKADEIVTDLAQHPAGLPAEEVAQARDFLRWLADDHFTFLGYREYSLERDADGQDMLRAIPGTGYGILRGDGDPTGTALPATVAKHARDRDLLVLTKANSPATVHRAAHLDYVGVKTFDDAGEVVGERRFVGLFSSGAYTESVNRIPLLREKARTVIDHAGYEPRSHAGKALLAVLENYPRDELFQTPVEDLEAMATAIMQAQTRRRLRLFVRRDRYGRFQSCLVYLPRDRYNTTVRERIAAILKRRLGGDTIEYTARVSESQMARLHFVVRPPAGGELLEPDVPALEREITEAVRSWRDGLTTALVGEHGAQQGSALAATYADAFPEAYKEDYSPEVGAADLVHLHALGPDDTALHLQTVQEDGGVDARLKFYRTGGSLALSTVLPVLTSMGFDVVDERPYQLDGLDTPAHIYDFGLTVGRELDAATTTLVEDAIQAVWRGQSEVDGFNGLVLAAGLSWRQALVLRAYTRYLRQGGLPYSQEYVETTLAGSVEITRLLAALFEARFDPGGKELPADAEARVAKCEEIRGRLRSALEQVAALDQDRILRSLLGCVEATLRTNFFQGTDEQPPEYLALKLDCAKVPDLVAPRPKFEIWVHSPRVEGVHLRFGAVARGGLRWSDRRDDFRTEVLGLVKAQMVKNTVIVPVGAKGGFVGRQLPDPGDREAFLAEGVACYRIFINALLDITDNLVEGDQGRQVVPPRRVVRHDGDDTYLVVAADKGTATFSDIANELSAAHGFWLGDAFASGGSAGYDHKAMGITAKGAWVSVQRHFRERGIDTQQEDFTCVGIGDMSGDVFGNGMLCSEHIRLVAAFDHRDIFLDPTPDAASSYAERRRIFDLPRSSWKDYDTSLISTGGGVFSRTAKSIPVGAEVRAALGLPDEVTKLSPPELMSAILKAPVDLLWNGGIGTYVKAATESAADAGDKANDAIRVNGADLRCACVGEGGNLGFTQRGRIEYALQGNGGSGGAINTDFIDNSAGVDTSDHEVNIKILLDRVMADGSLDRDGRNRLLASMTDEVAELVLRDNYQQNLALANSASQSASLLHVHEDWMRMLEHGGLLDRDLEALPSRREVARRIEAGEGLTVPELSVLLAYAKIVLSEDLQRSDIADETFLRSDLFSYFPPEMRQGYRQAMQAHPLQREIVVTQVVNDLINGAGITYLHRLTNETGASVPELTVANLVAREIFGTPGLLTRICDLDNQIDAGVQTRMRLEVRTLVERVTRWLVANRRAPMDAEAIADQFDVTAQRVVHALPDIMSGEELAAFASRRDDYVSRGVPVELASRVAAMPPAYMVMGIVETATRDEVDPLEVARVHFAVAERLGLPELVSRILALPRADRWQTMARAAIRDDLHNVHASLTAHVLAAFPGDAAERVSAWEEHDRSLIDQASATLGEICSEDTADLARLSVGLRVVRSLVS